MLYENKEKFAGFLIDDENIIRFAEKTREDAGKDQIDFLRMMADIIVKESSIEVTSDGAND